MTDAIFFILLLDVIFMLLAFREKESYLFAVSGFISFVFGIALSVTDISDPSYWAMSIIGFIMILLGFWLLIVSYQYTLKEKEE